MAIHMSGYLVSCNMWHWNIRWLGTTLVVSSGPEGTSEGCPWIHIVTLVLTFLQTSSTLLNIKFNNDLPGIYNSIANNIINSLLQSEYTGNVVVFSGVD